MRLLPKSIWPYYILDREDEDIRSDLRKIAEGLDGQFDVIVFIPNAGIYLHELFTDVFGDKFDTGFITIRRALSTSKSSPLKEFVFRRRWLSNIMRHVEVALRLLKTFTKMKRKRVVDKSVDVDVVGRRVLVIDDSVDTGTTMVIAREMLLEMGASEVLTGCVSNHLIPKRVPVDFSVYEYALIRTKNSKDYAAR